MYQSIILWIEHVQQQRALDPMEDIRKGFCSDRQVGGQMGSKHKARG
jgi:hypothetical protein